MADLPPAEVFFNRLFGDIPDALWILIWNLPTKNSWYFNDLVLAKDYALLVDNQGADAYFGLGLSSKDYGHTRRVKADDVAGITCLWADIDFGTTHKGKRLPPDRAAAMKIIDGIRLKPTIIVNSGHGLHCYWRFKEPWIFSDQAGIAEDTARKSAQHLCRCWSDALREIAGGLGWTVDATHDLSRVLRVPGTTNRKSDPVPVVIDHLESTGQYDFALDDFLQAIDAVLPRLPAAVTTKAQSGALALNANATPPFEKWQALCDVEPKFKASWDRLRKDLKDESPSAYDMSLASLAVGAGWPDQEIADLLVASRRRHGDDLKLREDYYRLTIDKARKSVTTDNLDVILEDLKTSAGSPKEYRASALAAISKSFGVNISRITKYEADEPIYHLETDRGSIMLGNANNLIKQDYLRTKLVEAADVLIPTFKPRKWDTIVREMLGLLDKVGLGEDVTLRGQGQAWIDAYLSEKPPTEDLNEAVRLRYPFLRDGDVYLFGTEFRRWVKAVYRENMSPRRLGAILRVSGCEVQQIGITLKGRRTTKSAWKLPAGYYDRNGEP